MRYFFLVYALIALLVVAIFGFRGQKFTKPPIRVFPDMDEQDRLGAQAPDQFFADDHGGRLPVSGTHPRGFNPSGADAIGGIPEPSFGGMPDYLHTGHVGDYYGNGMPEEIGLTDQAAAEAFIRHGQERYGIYCAVCHGESGNGQGMTWKYGVPVANNQNAKLNSLTRASYPDGRIFEVISQGKGLMGSYGSVIPVRDRWAIIAYIRTLEAAKSAP